MITYIKQLSLDATLIALGSHLRVEIENYKEDFLLERLHLIKALLKDYRSLYHRFMKINYPYNVLNDPSDLCEPSIFAEEIETALIKQYPDAKEDFLAWFCS